MTTGGHTVWDEFESPIDDAERSTFERITSDYQLISKIGEGTFSTVYKAEDRLQHQHDKSWLVSRDGNPDASYYVAIKRIYVTSSPQRIYNELDILRSLSGSENVLPMVTAFRHEDQVFVVLPYFKHLDFRVYYRELPIRDIRCYMRSLFLALEDVHAINVLHRDIKPTNFLYDVRGRKGELVDFGLAERQQIPGYCPCADRSGKSFLDMQGQVNPMHARMKGMYLKDDQRPGKRANRAGTRGFRAPEVLFKCDSQFTAVDIWSAGVILLTFLSTRFPFFNSTDDIEALIELSSIFGKTQMKDAGAQHNCSFETSIPSLFDRPISFTRLINWSRDVQRPDTAKADSREQVMAIEFLSRCLELDPFRRFSATEALQDEFLAGIEQDDLLDAQNSTVQDNEFDLGGLESAAEIDSPMPAQVSPTKTIPDQAVVYEDSTSETHSRLTGRPKEFVFLKTDDYPDENLHKQMRSQLITNVNTMRAKREASLRQVNHARQSITLRSPIKDGRARSASATFGQGDARPSTPLRQILPETSNQDLPRAASHSPVKQVYSTKSTIDPRLLGVQDHQ